MKTQTPLWQLCIEEGMMVTPRGLVNCRTKEFKAAEYKGINYNTRKLRKATKTSKA